MSKKVKSYIVAIIIPLIVGGAAALLTRDSMDIYKTVRQPPLAPPGILFPIVWSILYILMGVGSALVYNSDGDKTEKRIALVVYGIQLVVNFFWSIFFFNERLFLFSFVWLLLLWGLVLAMIFRFWKLNETAALLQIPYLLWVTFAGYLNLAIYLLNG